MYPMVIYCKHTFRIKNPEYLCKKSQKSYEQSIFYCPKIAREQTCNIWKRLMAKRSKARRFLHDLGPRGICRKAMSLPSLMNWLLPVSGPAEICYRFHLHQMVYIFLLHSVHHDRILAGDWRAPWWTCACLMVKTVLTVPVPFWGNILSSRVVKHEYNIVKMSLLNCTIYEVLSLTKHWEDWNQDF